MVIGKHDPIYILTNTNILALVSCIGYKNHISCFLLSLKDRTVNINSNYRTFLALSFSMLLQLLGHLSGPQLCEII